MEFELNSGMKIPSIGLGTWELTGITAKESVLNALESGYRLIDTATIYGNEVEVGDAIIESGINRDEIFVTTKLWNDAHNDVVGAFNRSLDALKLDYIDLYLIHWPPADGVHLDSWITMMELTKEGRTKSIGDSNYSIAEVEELIKPHILVGHVCVVGDAKKYLTALVVLDAVDEQLDLAAVISPKSIALPVDAIVM